MRYSEQPNKNDIFVNTVTVIVYVWFYICGNKFILFYLFIFLLYNYRRGESPHHADNIMQQGENLRLHDITGCALPSYGNPLQIQVKPPRLQDKNLHDSKVSKNSGRPLRT
jgi:hypothetical protein